MTWSKQNEAQIIAGLKQVEAGGHPKMWPGSRVFEAHDLRLKGQVRGHGSKEAEEIKHLQEENARLKKLVAD